MRGGTGAALLLAAAFSATRGAPLPRYTKDAGYCKPGTDVLDAEACRDAAAELALPFGAIVSLDAGHRHCYVGAESAVFYNSAAVYDAWPTPPNARLRSICRVEGGPQTWLRPDGYNATLDRWTNLGSSGDINPVLLSTTKTPSTPPALVTSSNGGALKDVTSLRGEKATIL